MSRLQRHTVYSMDFKHLDSLRSAPFFVTWHDHACFTSSSKLGKQPSEKRKRIKDTKCMANIFKNTGSSMPISCFRITKYRLLMQKPWCGAQCVHSNLRECLEWKFTKMPLEWGPWKKISSASQARHLSNEKLLYSKLVTTTHLFWKGLMTSVHKQQYPTHKCNIPKAHN